MGDCERRGGTYLGHEWSRCPVRETVEDQRLTVVRRLRSDSKLSPLSDWPSGYAAWVAELWTELEAKFHEREANELEAARNGKP